jgi:hypothetical protein
LPRAPDPLALARPLKGFSRRAEKEYTERYTTLKLLPAETALEGEHEGGVELPRTTECSPKDHNARGSEEGSQDSSGRRADVRAGVLTRHAVASLGWKEADCDRYSYAGIEEARERERNSPSVATFGLLLKNPEKNVDFLERPTPSRKGVNMEAIPENGITHIL